MIFQFFSGNKDWILNKNVTFQFSATLRVKSVEYKSSVTPLRETLRHFRLRTKEF